MCLHLHICLNLFYIYKNILKLKKKKKYINKYILNCSYNYKNKFYK